MTKRVKRTLIRLSLIASCALTCLFSASVTAAAESVEPTLSVNHFNLSFRDNVCVKYAVETNVEDVKLLVWREVSDDYTKGTEEKVLETVGVQVIEEKEHQIFDYTDLYAKNMTEDVYARAYAVVDGVEYYSPVKKYSILQYAYNKLGKTDVATTDEELKATLTQMLEYGAAVQNYLDYNLDRLPTDNFVQVKLSEGTLPDGFSEGLYKVGDTVVITAPETNNEGYVFEQWVDQDNTVVSETATCALPVGEENNTYTPLYKQTPQGLTFVSNGDGTCSVTGLGTCTDTELVIPSTSPEGDQVTSIGSSAFSNCSSVTSIEIPDSVTSIGSYAFYRCSSLTSIVIPDGVTSISPFAFALCSSLTSVEIPDGVTSIGEHAFDSCMNLTRIEIPNRVITIGSLAFYYCKKLTTIAIPDSVTSIGSATFADCRNLTSVTIGNSATKIGMRAFQNCSGLTSITFKDTSTWYFTSDLDYTGGSSISVINPSDNATYFSSTYCDYYWYKK